METLDGVQQPEIEVANPMIVQILQEIDAAEAISFDFFDTLFIRTVLDPEDVFDIVGKKFHIEAFRDLRRAAQSKAFVRMHELGEREITFDGIYSCLGDIGVSSEALKQAEYSIELSLVRPNAELIDLFLRVISSGKPVAITSDMYLPANFFRQALRKHALPEVLVLVSAEHNATKRDHGELFDVLASTLGVAHGKILHIGDNLRSDILQARAKGLATFQYVEHRKPPDIKQATPESSVARGLLRTHVHQIPQESFKELGFLHGGPAAVGFLNWIEAQSKKDNIDRVLFLARDGYILNRLANTCLATQLPRFDYLLGSRTAFTLATINEANFDDFLPFFASGSYGLSPCELLERIGVSAPNDAVMKSFGLGKDVKIAPQNITDVKEFVHAYRWEILKVCRRNRRALFTYLKELDIRSGDRIALVDVGWNGTTQEAFELAIHGMSSVNIFGYYFCLASTPERFRRQQTRRMSALFSSDVCSEELLSQIYSNRVGAEFFFSAPHYSVIGLDIGKNGSVIGVEDSRADNQQQLIQINSAVSEGIELFAHSYFSLQREMKMPMTPLNMAMPLVEFICDAKWKDNKLFNQVKNFDAWSFTFNCETSVAHY